MKRKHLVYLGAAAVGLYLIVRARKTTAGPPAVAGTVTSGDASVVIDDNVLSPNFGLPIHGVAPGVVNDLGPGALTTN